MKILIVFFALNTIIQGAHAGKKDKPSILECIRAMQGLPTIAASPNKREARASANIVNKIIKYQQDSTKHNKRFIRVVTIDEQVIGLSEIRDKDLQSMKLEITNILTGEIRTQITAEKDIVDVVMLANGSIVGIRTEGPHTEVFAKLGELDVLQRFTIENQHLDHIDIIQAKEKKTYIAGFRGGREFIDEKQHEVIVTHPEIFLMELDFMKDSIFVGHTTHKHDFWNIFLPLSTQKRLVMGEREFKYIELEGAIHFIDPNGKLLGVLSHEALLRVKK